MTQARIFEQRRSGILLHITSLPNGDLGQDAYRFIDFLQAAGISVWQVLPLGPTHADKSPYQCLSAHAGSNQLISREQIQQQTWCQEALDLSLPIDAIITHAYRLFLQYADGDHRHAFQQFCEQQRYWLDDYVLFQEIRQLRSGEAWFQWPQALRQRETEALQQIREQLAAKLLIRRFEQFIFFSQWQQLRHYANERNVHLFGDMPIFVAHDSADVWAEPALFTLDEGGWPTKVAGVPPDYFSATGQRWGNPLYQWQTHKAQNFDWWQRRLQTQLVLFDLIRVDHFRGFSACWEIPAHCDTAIDGKWTSAPGEQLFDALLQRFGELPLVAEDLGIITDEVTALRVRYAMPGMKILQFAFGGDGNNPYLPHQHERDSVTYTGTHDNNTTLGWYRQLIDHEREHVHAYLGETTEAMPWLLIRTALQSVSQLAMIPMQDILSLDENHRMNVPGTTEGNWRWQFSWEWLEESIAPRLRYLMDLYARH